MLLSYLKLSLRLLARNPFFTFINIAGLSIGFAAFIILWPYAQSELKSDQFHKDYKKIARLSRYYQYNEGKVDRGLYLAPHNSGIAKQFLNDYHEITDLTRIIPQEYFETFRQGFDKDLLIAVISKKKTKDFFREKNVAFADPNFFTFFSFPVVEGDAKYFLSRPNTVVLSEKNARKYFGNKSPINSLIYLNDTIPLTVTGVFKDLPRNTHMDFEMIMSTAGINALDLTGWMTNWFSLAYIKVRDDVNFTTLQNKINEQKEKIYGICPNCPENSFTSAYLQPLQEVVFTNLTGNPFTSKSKHLLITLEVLSFIILLLAWINYASLSIYQLKKRIHEIGTRKVVGARGKDLAIQFLTEAILINAISFLIGLTLVQLIETPIETWFNFYVINWHQLTISAIGITLIMPLLGFLIPCIYPIIISMRKQSILLLKKGASTGSLSWISTIVTIQYVSAIVLLVWIGIVYFQLDMILSKSIGIEKEGVVVIDCPLAQRKDFQNKLDYFLDQTTSMDGVQSVSISKSVVGDAAHYGIPVQRNKNDIEWGLDTNGGVDENFLKTYGIKLLYGRNFQSEMPADKNAILLSRAAVFRMGFSSPQEAIGAKLILPWSDRDDVEVVGIYEDYEFRPFFAGVFQKERGSFLSYKDHLVRDFYPSKISVKLNLSMTKECLGRIEKLYKEVFPQDIFRSFVLDENISQHYQGEKTARNQITIFTLIAIGIACLGLLGLISNKIIEKTKEIGIRKVLGAEPFHIAQILLNTTTKQVVTAMLIGIPIAYILTSQYLEKFSERIPLQWWHFALPIVILVVIMFTTIVSVLLKAARSNPVDALKHE